MVIKRLSGYKDSRGKLRGPGFYLFTRTGKRLLGGPYYTLRAVKQREKEVQAFKHMR